MVRVRSRIIADLLNPLVYRPALGTPAALAHGATPWNPTVLAEGDAPLVLAQGGDPPEPPRR